MRQEIWTNDEARQALRAGAETLAKVVASTLGPSGKSVILSLDDNTVVATKDGVTVAKAINLPNKRKNAGAQMLKQASVKTGEEAGDGTTTSTVLAAGIFLGNEFGKASNSVQFQKGAELAGKVAIDYIKDNMSKPVNGKNMLKSVATISANGDEEIGEIVSTALDSVGETGAVTVEESRTGETYLDIVEGIQFDRGYKSPYFVTDNNTMTSVLEDVVVLLVDKNIHNIKDLLPVLEGVVTSSKSMLIISEDVSGEVLSTLVLNKVRGGLKICAVKAPDFGDRRKEILQDIAILTGGTVVSPDKGMRLDKFNPEWLGTAKKAVISRDKTTIIGAEGKPEEIDKRISEIEHQIETAKTVFDKEQLQARLGRFAQGVAVMYVGGRTELEMKERKDRVDDALHATKAALEEGICPGGGSTLYYVAANVLGKFELDSTTTPSFQAGFKAVTEACRKPFQQILWNLGLTKEEVLEIGQKVEKSDAWDIYDISSGNVGNAMEIGVIDPVKVVRLALQNAISVAATMATSEALIVNILDDKKRDEEDLTY